MANRLFGISLALILIVGTVTGVIFLLDRLGMISVPVSKVDLTLAIVIGGISLTTAISSLVKSRATSILSKGAAEGIAITVQVIGYTVTGVGLLSLLNIGLSSALFGGTVVGLVLGYAAQYTLANFFGGILLFLSHPFRVGDRITMTTWQYGLLTPTFPPKYYSSDYLIPGFTGIVDDITLMYTTVITDDGVPLKVPNSIIVQAAVLIHREETRRVRARFDLDASLDVNSFIHEAGQEVSKIQGVVSTPLIMINEVYQNNVVIMVEG